jgi:predicted enzyme related to lactoylglutathione lyase
MNLSVSHCFVLVNDQDEALGFYRDVLGLTVKADVMFGPNRWLAIGSATQPGVEIVLETPRMRLGPDAPALSALMAKGALTAVVFVTDDCDATFEKVLASGADVVQEPIDQPYGVRDCAFRDPSGNMVRFSEHPAPLRAE